MQIRYADAFTRLRILNVLDPRFSRVEMVLDTNMAPGTAEVISGCNRTSINTSFCLLLLSVISHSAGAEFSAGVSAPFYLDTDLQGGDVGGYGFNAEYQAGKWFVAYDRLNSVKRRGGHVDQQDFITTGYRHAFASQFHIQAGVAVHQRSDVVGSYASFNVGVGYQRGRYRVTWQHWSNANTSTTNHGFDALTIQRELSR